MKEISEYLDHVLTVRRYSVRTRDIYREVLEEWSSWVTGRGLVEGECTVEALAPNIIRTYEVHLLEERKLVPRTVNLHLSVLSGFCRYLVRRGLMESNPVALVTRPKEARRLPEFYRKESMDLYFNETAYYAGEEALEMFRTAWEGAAGSQAHAADLYDRRLRRAVILTLYALGIRRSELIGLEIADLDFRRRVALIRGKGDKMREIPLTDIFCKEISLYLHAVEVLLQRNRSLKETVFVTRKGFPLYPEFVDNAVKTELGGVKGISGRLSAHVLRHSLATELLSAGTGLNSIKELLGHSSLAATQVYTHNTISQLKTIYQSAHPRAKSGGKYGD